MYRSLTNQKAYNERKLIATTCPFCDREEDMLVKDGTLMYVRKNRFPYNMWDWRKVEEHLMVIPKRHIECMGDLTFFEEHELQSIIKEYIRDGYDIYTRNQKSANRSQPHLHTHMIKTTGSLLKDFKLLFNEHAIEL